MMRPGLARKAAVLIAPLIISAPASAAENAGAWRVIQSDEFRQGFVAGIASYLLELADGGPDAAALRAGYAECLAGRTDRSLLDVVDAYMERHPDTASYMPAAVTTLALNELCGVYIPKPPVMPQ
jgi:hypothetical protein